MVVGLGTGDTAAQFIHALAERLTSLGQLSTVRCVATSLKSAALGRQLGLQVVELDSLPPSSREQPSIDLTVDGADEIDPALRLIKGAGGALLFEKLTAIASRELIIVADAGKLVARLGEKRRLPVEIVAFGAHHTLARLRAVAGVLAADLRQAAAGKSESSDGLYITDSGNRIVDLALAPDVDAQALHAALKALPGVIETGLFLAEATRILVGDPSGQVEVKNRSPHS
jgi:ribose 5-phosphate isomerase A